MEPATLGEISTQAHKLHEDGAKWHFHILTPTCKLNEASEYAFILECPEKQLALVYYSDHAEKELGQELSPLLHGSKIMNQETTDATYTPSETVEKIVERAKMLNSKNIEWHHHVLFPGCRFNTHSPEFTLVFENSQASEPLESVSDAEPTNDLKQIETLFYKK